MYIFNIEVPIKLNKTRASEIIGITRPVLSNILNGKVACRKVVAYCITKYLNDEANIEDYFIKIGG